MIGRSLRRCPTAWALALVAALACSGRDRSASDAPPDAQRIPERAPARAGSATPDRPAEALRLGADGVSSRIGSFAWEGDVTWTVEKPGATPLRATERHRLRQLASGDFEASVEIDPGGGPGSETGATVIQAGRKVYARGRWAPWRERPTDRGTAQRFRDDGFRAGADVAALLGPALVLQAAGGTSLHGRSARRFSLSLGSPGATEPSPGAGGASASNDPDTTRRRAFLDGRVPTAVSGELIVDGATGVPLALTLRASFAERSDPQLKADVAVDARITTLGHLVAAVHPPAHVLPDDRKPKGVARALEAAGLRKRGAPSSAPTAEPEGEEEPTDEAP